MNKCSLDRNQARNLVKKLTDAGILVQLFDEVYIHQEEMKLYEKRVVKFLDAFHKEFPLKEGMGIEEARNKLQLGSNTKVIEAILECLKKNKVIKEDKGVISNYRFKVVVKEDEDALLREITEAYLAFGFAPLATDLYMKEHSKQKKFKPVFTSLLNKKVLIRLDDQYCLHKDFYEKAKETVRKIAAEKSVVELGEFRESIGCSRRVAVPILEHFDKTGFTVKTSEGRILK
jgi:selenocysteine-specific elongation factor